MPEDKFFLRHFQFKLYELWMVELIPNKVLFIQFGQSDWRSLGFKIYFWQFLMIVSKFYCSYRLSNIYKRNYQSLLAKIFANKCDPCGARCIGFFILLITRQRHVESRDIILKILFCGQAETTTEIVWKRCISFCAGYE